MPAATSGVPSEEQLSTTITSLTRFQGRSARTRPIASASLRVGMMTEILTLPLLSYHQSDDGRLRDKNASTPQVRPAVPTNSASEAIIGTNSSHIHAVPHSETHRLERNANATSAAGRVHRPSSSSTPREISVAA